MITGPSAIATSNAVGAIKKAKRIQSVSFMVVTSIDDQRGVCLLKPRPRTPCRHPWNRDVVLHDTTVR